MLCPRVTDGLYFQVCRKRASSAMGEVGLDDEIYETGTAGVLLSTICYVDICCASLMNPVLFRPCIRCC